MYEKHQKKMRCLHMSENDLLTEFKKYVNNNPNLFGESSIQ